jgi:REP element-mobilizing transposase RayT
MPRISSGYLEKDSIVHIVHRGTRGFEIVKDELDKWHFLKALYFTNDKNTTGHWNRDLDLASSELAKIELGSLRAKMKWDKREIYTNILAYCLMSNHFHLLIVVKKPEDLGRFMQRLSISMAMRFNKKYKTKGSLFESGYKISIVDTNQYLNFVVPYILYKNVCELFPGGIKTAIKNPSKSFEFASKYNFASLGDLLGSRPQSSIIEKDVLNEYFEIPKDVNDIKKWFVEYLEARPDTKSDMDYILE